MNLLWIIFCFKFIIQVYCELTPVLHCHSNMPVYCYWFLNNKPVMVTEQNGLKYQDSTSALTTNNCSINIMRFNNPKFQGNWTCWSQSTDNNEGSQLVIHRYDLDNLYKIKNDFNKTEETPAITAKIGADVRIKCRFDVSVKFHWMRNGEPVKIRGRYRLTNNEEGLYSTDCSLHISNVSAIDLGLWKCSAYFNSGKDYVETKPLSVLPQGIKASDGQARITTEIRVHPQSQRVSADEDVTLHCSFSHAVACAWFVNNKRLLVHYKFAYLDYKESHRSFSTNCSIRISKITWREFGEWTCFGLGNDTHYSIRTKSAVLSEKSFVHTNFKPIVLNIDNNAIKTKTSDDVKIMCAFNKSRQDKITMCKWLRNGIPVLISGRYFNQQPISSSDFITDCSIKIQKIEAIDEGLWECLAQDALHNMAKIRTNITIINMTTDIGYLHFSTFPGPTIQTSINPPFIDRSQNYIKPIIIVSCVVLFLGMLAAMLLWANGKRHQAKNSSKSKFISNKKNDIENSVDELSDKKPIFP